MCLEGTMARQRAQMLFIYLLLSFFAIYRIEAQLSHLLQKQIASPVFQPNALIVNSAF